MFSWSDVGGLAAAIAVVITLVIFLLESRRRASEERASLKREAISRILTTMEKSVRANQGFMSSLRFWVNPDLEYSLAIPRLLHDLGADHNEVSVWAFSRVQAIAGARSDKAATEIGLRTCMKLVEWGQGGVPDSWFTAELSNQPALARYRAPLRNVILRFFFRLRNAILAIGSLTLIGWGISNIVRSLRPKSSKDGSHSGGRGATVAKSKKRDG